MQRPEGWRTCRIGTAAALLLMALLGACTPQFVTMGPPTGTPHLDAQLFTARDGLALPYRRWMPDDAPKAVIVALHGFNDYSAFFEEPAAFLAARGIASYAYDQRGFGAGAYHGRWFKTARYLDDAADFTRAVAQRHPGVPVYLLGESMGGAVTMATLVRDDPSWIAGAILAAPAVWGREVMPWYQTSLLWFAAHTVPALELTGRGLNIKPSDNIEMLRALGRDPLVIKSTRVDAIYGLVDLMDLALSSAPRLDGPTLILYGGQDEIIKPGPTRTMLARLPVAAQRRRIAVYAGGYHMLLRDLDAPVVWGDIAAWIANPNAPLPSGAEAPAKAFADGG